MIYPVVCREEEGLGFALEQRVSDIQRSNLALGIPGRWRETQVRAVCPSYLVY